MEPSIPPESLSQTDWQHTPPAVQACLFTLHQRLAQLQEQIDQLQKRLQRTSKTSDKPPSSDSPFQRPVSKQDKPPGKRGARMGHPGSGSRLRRPTERRAIHPGPCACGQGVLGQTAPYHLHQVMELPPMALHVTHWVLRQGRCSGCGRLLKARLPKAQQTGHGPRLTALIGELSAMHRISRRGVQDFCRSVLGAPNQPGGDSASGSLIKDWRGILVSDGYGVYQAWGNARQTCLAHLIRRARELSQRQVPGLAACGKAVLQELQRLCQMAHAPPSGGQWQAWYARLCRLMKRHGLRPDDGGRLVRCLRRELGSLWVFLNESGVEPTNNRAERALRFGVLWRKSSLGTASIKGNAWVQRSLSLRQTCRQLEQSTFSVLVDALEAFMHDRPPDLSWLYDNPSHCTAL